MIEAGEPATVLAGLLAAQVLAFAALWYWVAKLGGTARSEGGDGPEGVTCRNCGTHNAAEYRFCRRCIAELPGPGAATPGSPGPPGGLDS